MLFGILISLFALLCFVLILLILIQKGKSSMGLGNLGGGAQTLFGGSGGQDIFQKITWTLGAIFMGGSIGLTLIKKPVTSALLEKIAQKQAPLQTATEKLIEEKKEEAQSIAVDPITEKVLTEELIAAEQLAPQALKNPAERPVEQPRKKQIEKPIEQPIEIQQKNK